MRRSGAAILFLTMLVPVSAWSLEVREGRIKLVLHEEIGKYSLYYLDDLQKNTYAPLFVDVDPRTSGTSVVIDNRVVRLGESSYFQQTASRTAKGGEFVWTSRTLQVTQSFEPIASPGSQLADGVKITLGIKNLGEAAQSIGVRILVDTFLGEEETAHFTTDDGTDISGETEYLSSNMIEHWVSRDTRAKSGLGLLCVTTGDSITIPDRLVFANWQRLNDASWAFATSTARRFSNLPYSINDSAVVQYYNPESLAGGSERRIVSVVGMLAEKVFDLSGAAEVSTSGSALLDSVSSTSNISDPVLAVRADLQVVENLLRSVEAYLADPGSVSAEDLEILEDVLKELKSRAESYTER